MLLHELSCGLRLLPLELASLQLSLYSLLQGLDFSVVQALPAV